MISLDRRQLVVGALLGLPAGAGTPAAAQGDVRDIGSRRELFVDRYLIDRLQGIRQTLYPLRDEGIVLRFDRPWEGRFCGYTTLLHEAGRYRAYYRGRPIAGKDGTNDEVTCVAESADGRVFTRPSLGLHEVGGSRENNVILAGAAPLSHNLAPFVDRNPASPASARYKALGGIRTSGLIGFVSADGFRWTRVREAPVITEGAFDSQNVAFWSPAEKRYLCYLRTFKRIGDTGYRWISRCESDDFLTWTRPVEMSFGDVPPEHLYTNQTHPYFRAEHLYLGTAARFFPGRQVLTEEQAKAINVDPGYFKDTSDAVLLSSRGGATYERTFLEGFIRPGIGAGNWVSRTNYPALNIVPTGPAEMSLYVQQDYGQPTAHLRRYSMRLDGMAGLQAPYAGGEVLTRPLRFAGDTLTLNFATSAAGGIRVELQDAQGGPIPGFGLADCREVIGNEIERAVAWRGGSLAGLAGRPIRMRIAMKDADLFSLRFGPSG